jgi:cytochrome c553
MKPPGARPSCRWRWLALLFAIALLAPTWRPATVDGERIAPAAAAQPRDAPLTHAADCVACRAAPSQRGHVHALAQCSACHLPQPRGDASSPMLARLSVERLRRPPQMPMPAAHDEARVRAGGEVYLHACTRCHERDRQASSSGEPRSLAVSIDDGARRARAGTAIDAPLGDERMAALAAFLRRHAGTSPWLDAARGARDASL